MPEYLVGDVVTVRSDLVVGNDYNHTEFTEEMNWLAGKQVTIRSVDSDQYGYYYYIENMYGVYWDASMFIGQTDPTYDISSDALLEVLNNV